MNNKHAGITYVITHLLTPWSRVLLEKLTSSQLDKKFSMLCGIRRFVSTFKSTRHLSLSWYTPIQNMPLIPLPEDPS